MSCCFRFRRASSAAAPKARSVPHQQTEEDTASTDLPTPSTTSRSGQSPSPTINLTNHEYLRATEARSYTEIWSKMHPTPGNSSGEDLIISSVLRPDRASVQEALGDVHSPNLARLVSDYFDGSEHTSRLCLDLQLSINRARSIYSPLHLVLEVLPDDVGSSLSRAQCEWAFDNLLTFDSSANPFLLAEECAFDKMRQCFGQLKQQLDFRLHKAKKKINRHRSLTRSSALCLIGAVVGIAIAGLVIATHAVVALMAGPIAFQAFLCRPTDLLASTRKNIKKNVSQLDAAAKGTFVLNNDLDTIERLVSRLHETVESDKALVRLGIERGRGERHPMEEVIRQLRKNQPSFENQLRDLEEHICLCFAAVNKARSMLLQHIQHQQP